MPNGDAESLLDAALKRITAEEEAPQAAVLPSQTQVQRELGVPRKTETFQQRNYAGFPIDVTSGAPVSVRFNLARQPTEEEKLGYLNSIYGAGMARKADTGEFLVKVLDPATSKPKELLVNEQGLTAGDVGAVAAYAPETAAALASMYGGRRIPKVGAVKGVLGFERDVAAMALGQEAGGAISDIATRAQFGTEIQPEEILSRRLRNVPFDVAMANALGAAGAVAGKLATPLGLAKGVVDVEAAEAVKRLAATTGETIPLSIGEATGSQVFKRIEATAAQLPGSSKYFSELLEAKTASLRKVMNKIMGLPDEAAPGALPTTEQVGEGAVTALKAKLTPVQEAIEASRNQAIKDANKQILDTLEKATIPGRQIYPEKTGAAIRQAAFDKREAFQAQSRILYDEALNLPGGRDRIFETPGLAADAKRLMKSLPQKTEVAEEVAYDAYGNPITRTAKGAVPSKEFVPENVTGKLKELAANPKEQRSLQDLIQMRSEVDNAIAEGEAIPGRQTKYLSEIRKSLTSAIDDAVSDNPALKSAFEKANAFYRENVGQFHDKYIARLFREIEQGGGFINDEDIIRNIGPTEYASFKKFLGASSPEFANLKRAIVDELYNSALLPGENLVKGEAFIKNLSKFFQKNRSVAEDILGTKAINLQRLGEVLVGVDSKIDAEALKKLLVAGEPLEGSVRKLVAEQANLDKLYRSKILKEIGEGKLGEGFDASEFVNRFYESASKNEIQSVLSQLADNPEALESLRRKLIQKVMFEAQRKAKVVDPASLGRGDPLLPPNAGAMRKAVGDLDRRGNLELMLGKETFDQLMDLSKVTRAGEVSEQAFRAAGGLIAGSQLSQMLRGGVLSYASDYVKQRLASIVLASPILRKWASNAVMDTPLSIGGVELAKTKQGALLTTLIGSTPFLEAVNDELGQGTAANQFMAALRRSINIWEQTQEKKKVKPTAEQLLDQRIFKIQQGQ